MSGASEPCVEAGLQEKQPEELSEEEKSRLFKVAFLAGPVISIVDANDQGFFTFLPGYCEQLGVSKGVTGTIIGVNGLGILLLSPFVPRLIPYFGGDHKMVFYSLLGFVVTRIMLIPVQWASNLIAFQSSLIGIFGITGLLYAMAEVGITSWTLTSVAAEHRTQAFAVLMEARGLGALLGPVIGGALFSWGGWAVTFGVFALSIAGGALYMKTSKVYIEDDRQNGNSDTKGGSVLRDKRVFLTWLGNLFIYATMCYNFVILQPLLEFKFGVQPWAYGLIATSSVLMFVIGAEITKVLEKMVGSITGIALSCIPAFISYLLMGPSPLLPFVSQTNVWIQVVAMWLNSLSLAIPMIMFPPLSMNYAIEAGFDKNTASAQIGALNVVSSGGSFMIGPMLAGYMAQWLGDRWALTSFGLFLTILIVLVVALTARAGKPVTISSDENAISEVWVKK